MVDPREPPGGAPAQRLSPAKLELLRRLQAKAGPRRLADEPIAVVGLALRLPGAPNYPALWRLLAEGRDAITEVPTTRWSLAGLYHPDPRRAGGLSSRWGGFLPDIDSFDAELFAISPREAATLDPQHRLLLETSWLALEDAGLRRDQLRGRKAGVFVACYQRDYAKLATQDRFQIDAYTASGTHHSMVAGRLAYLLDVHGPALVVDTACSSSLVALHLACRSLLSGESELALVGASNLMLSPEESVALSRWGMLAPDGRCKPFDARADGFVRGEGVVSLVLARQRDALAAGLRVRALVCGTAVNQDGHSNGLTAPNSAAQAAVLRAALDDAALAPEAVSYVEAHGTGTALGDPIEVEALRAVYGAGGGERRDRGTRPGVCRIGSLKSNVGHLEASAGLAGVAKTIACLEHRAIPATLHFQRLNPAIELGDSRLEIAADHRPWAHTGEGPRHAGVSSFGMGGTNAHVILREAERPPTRSFAPARRAWVLPVSAHLGAALRERVTALQAQLEQLGDDTAALDELCATAARSRTHHPQQRLALVGDSARALARELAERSAGLGGRGLTRAPAEGVVFVCPGQGGQWRGMGRALLAAGGPFAETLAACDAAIAPLAGWSILDALRDPDPELDLDRIDRVQPLLFALSLSYAALWRSYGLHPDACIGHSMGEVAAAQLCGHLSLADAARVIVRRSALMHELSGTGTMLAVALPAAKLEARLAPHNRGSGAGLALAADNGPSASVVSGPHAAVEALARELEAAGVRCRRVAVEVASHGPAVEVLDARLDAALASIAPPAGPAAGERPRPALYSTLEARRLDPRAHLDADYWRRNLRERVRLWPAVEASLDDGHGVFIELGPHPVLLPAIGEGLDARGLRGLLLGSGRRDEDETLEQGRGLARLYEAGRAIDWEGVYPERSAHAELPPYPFVRKRYWLPRPRTRSANLHPFLDRDLPLAGAGPHAAWLWTGTVDLERGPYLRDHHVEGSCVLPGMGSVDLVLAALASAGHEDRELREVVFERPIVVAEDQAVELQLRVEDGRFELWGQRGDTGASGWLRRVHGRVRPRAAAGEALALTPLRAEARPRETREPFYAALNASGNLWGPAFQGVREIFELPADGALWVELEIPPEIRDELERHRFHPALLDACAQAMLSAMDETPGSLVLAEIGRVAIHGPAQRVHASWIRLDPNQQPGSLRADVTVVDREGARLVEIEGLRVQFIHQQRRTWFHALRWRPPAESPVETKASAPGPIAVLGAPEPVVEALRAALDARGLDASFPATIEAIPAAAAELVWLWSPEPEPAPEHRALEAAVDAGDALLRACSSTRARLWLVSFAGAPTLGDPDPVQAALWGLGRVLEVERGRAFARSVDLDAVLDPRAPADAETLASILADELTIAAGPRVVAHRGGRRLEARLEPAALAIPGAPAGPLARLEPGASYLITGGLGGLGLRTAAQLVSRGARHLILLGRSAPPPRSTWAELEAGTDTRTRVDALLALERRGASVQLAALDVADRRALASFVDSWRREQRPPIRGIIHAAGVQHPRALAELDADALREDLRAKLGGAAAIDAVSAELELELDFVVAYSSAASLVPSPLLGGYTAANASLDAWATRARGRGRPVSAVSWGLLQSGGMARRHAAARGELEAFTSMDPSLAFAHLDAMLDHGHGHLGIMAVDWDAWVARHPELGASPYFQALTQAPHPEPNPALEPRAALDPSTLAGPELRARLDAYLRVQLARILHLDLEAARALDAEIPLTGLGIDSLMALELRNRVEAETGAAPAVVELLRGISLAGLVELVARSVDSPDPPDPPDPPDEDWEEFTI